GGHAAGDLEGHLRRVDLVERAVDEGGLDVDHRVAGDHAARQRVADALLGRLPELAGHGPTHDLGLELEAAPARQRLESDDRVPVLALAAGLPHESAL